MLTNVVVFINRKTTKSIFFRYKHIHKCMWPVRGSQFITDYPMYWQHNAYDCVSACINYYDRCYGNVVKGFSALQFAYWQ
jgi:hypothetical protein